ncbi:MAG: transporter substrate-binding domain-containing protein [Erysipelotrichaceae bacterium]
MKIIKKYLLIVLTLFVIVGVINIPVLAQEIKKEQRIVKVAYPIQKYLSEVDESGARSGYSYEYLVKIAEFANWKLEYVNYPDRELNEQIIDSMKDLENGRVDIIGVMLKNSALEEKYLYPKENYGVVYTTLDVLDTNFNVTQTNLVLQKNLRVAALRNAKTRNAEVEAYLQSIKVDHEYIYCDSVEEQIAALNDGKADAMIKVSLTFLPNLRKVAEFAARPYYFIASKGNEELIKEMDDAILKIHHTDPFFENRLQAKYFNKTISDFSLNTAEKAFIEKEREIDVLFIPGYAPFAFVDRNNVLRGMSVTILDNIGKRTGLKFRYNVFDASMDLNDEISSGKYDMVVGPPHS